MSQTTTAVRAASQVAGLVVVIQRVASDEAGTRFRNWNCNVRYQLNSNTYGDTFGDAKFNAVYGISVRIRLMLDSSKWWLKRRKERQLLPYFVHDCC